LSTGASWLLLAYLLVAAWILVRLGTPLRRWLDRTLSPYVAPVDINGASA
jgi:hypothetical protein